MSEIIRLKVSGSKDLGCITPEEIVRFCIDNNVDRINSMGNIWRCINKITNDKKESTNISDFAFEISDPTNFVIEQINEWEFDIN